MLAFDPFLQYKWVIDDGCISGHLRPSYWSHLRHTVRFSEKGIWEYAGEERYHRYLRLLFSPIRGAQIAGIHHALSALIAYPVFRYLLSLSAVRAERVARSGEPFEPGLNK